MQHVPGAAGCAWRIPRSLLSTSSRSVYHIQQVPVLPVVPGTTSALQDGGFGQ
jgi:hypothetical protein